ncbi:MAG: hypothetical protein ACJ74O_17840 [Frankiaceae bacterium]
MSDVATRQTVQDQLRAALGPTASAVADLIITELLREQSIGLLGTDELEEQLILLAAMVDSTLPAPVGDPAVLSPVGEWLARALYLSR